MRRGFDYDDEETPSWEAGEEEYEDMEGGSVDMDPSMLDMMQLDLEAQHINNTVLQTTIRLLEHSWFWNLRRVKTKVRMVKEVYQAMLQLVQSRDGTPPQEESK